VTDRKPLDLSKYGFRVTDRVKAVPGFEVRRLEAPGDFALIEWNPVGDRRLRTLRSIQVEREVAELWAAAPDMLREIVELRRVVRAQHEALRAARTYLPQADSLPLRTKTRVGDTLVNVEEALTLAAPWIEGGGKESDE
jgi:hypothetical protein